MNELLTAAATLPAALFTALVLVVIAYWIMVGLGALDFDFLHLHVDADAHADVGDADAHVGGHGLLEFLSIGKVPITVLGTLFVLGGWLLCLGAEILVRPILPDFLAGWPASLGFGISAVLLAIIGTALVSRPLRPLFSIAEGTRREHLIGRQALVTSQTVDQRFGTATCFIDGDDILLNVVVRDERRPVKGDDVVIIDYDDEAGVHIVAPLRLGSLPEPAPEPVDLRPVSPPPPARVPDAES